MMTDNINLEQTFHFWRTTRTEKMAEDNPSASSRRHLDQKSLIDLARSGGLEKAAGTALEHLDRCPSCLAEWASWRRAFSLTEDEQSADHSDLDTTAALDHGFSLKPAFGYLEAAAGSEMKPQALVLESSCGTYRLEVLPDRQETGSGMVILSKLTGNPARTVTLRDRKGEIVLSGVLENDRLARIYKNLNELDLSIWTVS